MSLCVVFLRVAFPRAVAPAVVDQLQALRHVMRVSRTWDSTMSLLPKGGEAVWGNASSAPDDTFHCTRRRWVTTAATVCASDKVSEAAESGNLNPGSTSTSSVPNPLLGATSGSASTGGANSGTTGSKWGEGKECSVGSEGAGGEGRVLYERSRVTNRPKYGRMVSPTIHQVALYLMPCVCTVSRADGWYDDGAPDTPKRQRGEKEGIQKGRLVVLLCAYCVVSACDLWACSRHSRRQGADPLCCWLTLLVLP